MKIKTIPFDLETAKKIQAGEIEGKIKTRGGEIVNDLHVFSTKRAYCLYASIGDIVVHSYTADGYEREWDKTNRWDDDLVLEVPYNEPVFKPFDRVLVRGRDGVWHPSLYATTDGLLYYTIDCKNWQQCIPYEGNQELVGTCNEPKSR